MNTLRARIQQAATQSEHLRAVLEAADSADRRMAESVTRPRPQPLLRGAEPEDEAPIAAAETVADEASTRGA